MSSDTIERWLLRAGLIISGVLLIRFAIDFSIDMKWWLAVPLWLLVIAALSVSATNVLGSIRWDTQSNLRTKSLLLAVIPLGFFTSSLDCTGLGLQGCSPFCTVMKLLWIPLIATVCIVYYFTGKRGWLTLVSGMSFVALFPHCVCYNAGNAWWIDRIGVSPMCYGWGFVLSIIAVGAMRSGRVWPSISVCMAIIAGAAGFFISHHYFCFPW